ncbi:hypothetical protein VCHA53O466_50322 [Vibrio chagasii]|nr:hypothetical protein VCHA53O466_50322 [Vibrio chagasii]
MIEYSEGDKSTALCEDCKGKVSTTFKFRDIPFSGETGIAKGILVGVCDGCDRTVSIPHQSSAAISEQLAEQRHSKRTMYLTALEIKNLAEYALGITIPENGLGVEESELDDFEFSIEPDVKVQDDDGSVKLYRRVVRCDGCEGNECIPISDGVIDPDYQASQRELLDRAESAILGGSEFGLSVTSDMSREEVRKHMREARDKVRSEQDSCVLNG